MQTLHLSEKRPRQNGISCRRTFYALGLAAVFAGSVLLFFSQTIRLSISTSSAHYGFFRIPVFLYPYEIQKGSWVLFTLNSPQRTGVFQSRYSLCQTD